MTKCIKNESVVQEPLFRTVGSHLSAVFIVFKDGVTNWLLFPKTEGQKTLLNHWCLLLSTFPQDLVNNGALVAISNKNNETPLDKAKPYLSNTLRGEEAKPVRDPQLTASSDVRFPCRSKNACDSLSFTILLLRG